MRMSHESIEEQFETGDSAQSIIVQNWIQTLQASPPINPQLCSDGCSTQEPVICGEV